MRHRAALECDTAGEWTPLERGLLRLAHLRRGHHLHRFGDLRRALIDLMRRRMSRVLAYSPRSAPHRPSNWSPSAAASVRRSRPVAERLFSRPICSSIDFRVVRNRSKLGLELLDPLDRHVVHVAVLHHPQHRHLNLDRNRVYCGCLNSSTMRLPRSILACVVASRSEPNCANAASSRNCARSPLSCPATCFIALSCAAEPTRDTDKPTEIAGRTP